MEEIDKGETVTIVNNDVPEQMKRSRFVNGRFERLEGEEWVPWPVLTIDKLGSDEARRMTIQHSPKDR